MKRTTNVMIAIENRRKNELNIWCDQTENDITQTDERKHKTTVSFQLRSIKSYFYHMNIVIEFLFQVYVRVNRTRAESVGVLFPT